MARLPRFFVKGEALHVIQRGNNREPIFAADGDFRFYLECLTQAASKHGLTLHAYVLMTNHVHLVATPSNEVSLPSTMQSVGRRYVQYFNCRYRRTGTLWEGRYRATLIDSERYLLACMRYVELNPVRASMVRQPAEYGWSSYRANALGAPAAQIVLHEVYLRLGRTPEARQSAYRRLFGARVDPVELETIRQATNKAWALGNDRFRDRIEELAGRRAAPLRRVRSQGNEPGSHV